MDGSTLTKFGAVCADPPWRYVAWSGDRREKRTAESHYPTMTLDAIKALNVKSIVGEDSVLFLWSTMPFLSHAMSVMSAWGFEYVTVAFTWVKMNKVNGRPFIGLGHWTRANSELCLLGRTGRPRRLARDVQQVILSTITRHSEKPDEAYERITRLVAGPYVELFARKPRAGWSTWGDEVMDDASIGSRLLEAK